MKECTIWEVDRRRITARVAKDLDQGTPPAANVCCQTSENPRVGSSILPCATNNLQSRAFTIVLRAPVQPQLRGAWCNLVQRWAGWELQAQGCALVKGE